MASLGRRRIVVLGLIGLYLAIQILVPLRHHLYPGNPSWTEEGHSFAWRMLLRSKHGEGEYHVRAFDPGSGTTYDEVLTTSDLDLSRRHRRRIWTRPDMTLEYAHFIADEWASKGYEDIEVRARVLANLNSRPSQPIIDPEVNLVEVKRSLKPAPWILPLKEIRGDDPGR